LADYSCSQAVQLWLTAAVLFAPVRVGPFAIAMIGFFVNGITMFNKVTTVLHSQPSRNALF
jgi:hypothetical protein